MIAIAPSALATADLNSTLPHSPLVCSREVEEDMLKEAYHLLWIRDNPEVGKDKNCDEVRGRGKKLGGGVTEKQREAWKSVTTSRLSEQEASLFSLAEKIREEFFLSLLLSRYECQGGAPPRPPAPRRSCRPTRKLIFTYLLNFL